MHIRTVAPHLQWAAKVQADRPHDGAHAVAQAKAEVPVAKLQAFGGALVGVTTQPQSQQHQQGQAKACGGVQADQVVGHLSCPCQSSATQSGHEVAR